MQKIIKTSKPDWLEQLAKAYKDLETIELVDDAHVGIDPGNQTLLDMGRRAVLSPREWAGVFVALGVAALGAWLLVMAVLDPEPYTKVAFAIGTGAVLAGSSGFYAVKVLTRVKPPNVKVTGPGVFEIGWT